MLPKRLTLQNLYFAAYATTGDVMVSTLAGADLMIAFANAGDRAMTTSVALNPVAQMNGGPLPDGTAFVTGRSVSLDNGVVIPIGRVLSIPTN